MNTRTEPWNPANKTDLAMATAVATRDQVAYFKLVATATLYLPAAPDEQQSATRFLTWDMLGHRYLPVFTSLDLLRLFFQGSVTSYRTTSYPALVEHWPDQHWLLAVNPGSPIDAYLPLAQVAEAAAGRLTVPDATDLLAESAAERGLDLSTELRAAFKNHEVQPADEVEEQLLAAARDRDIDRYLAGLMAANVLVPTAWVVPDAGRITEPDFPWRVIRSPHSPTIEVFTSRKLMANALPPNTPSVSVDFATMLLAWPGESCRLAVNPGTAIGVEFSPEDLVGVAAWALEKMTQLGEPTVEDVELPAEDVPPEPEPATTDPVVLAAGPDMPASPPVLLQKVVPHAQVADHLERAGNRVAGFLNPYQEVQELRTPQDLYQGLGLVHKGTPFRPEDESVCVLRWTGYVPALYRVPRGGRDEGAIDLMGGWVVEPAPFTGTGISPGEAAARELKVDAVVLPHGAQLLRIGADGTEALVGNYDADHQHWVVVGFRGEGELPRTPRPTVRNGYFARLDGRDYEASPDGDNLRLYTSRPAGSFEKVHPGRYRRIVPAGEVERFGYVHTVSTWRDSPVIVLAERKDQAEVEYTGGRGPVAERLGLKRYEWGVYRGWVPRDELYETHEEWTAAF